MNSRRVGGSVPHRSGFVALASLISLVIGITGVAIFAIVLDLFFNGALYSIPFINLILVPLTGIAIPVGGAAVALSITHIVIAWMLWRSSKYGGVGGLVIAATDVVSYLFLVMISQTLLFVASPILIAGLFLISATVAGWYNLR
jgi:hypothetical protein